MHPYNDNFGDWRGLGTSSQAPRYALIAEMLRRWDADRNVLDVGCGEAVLRSWLPKETGYLGIEPSTLAIKTAIEMNPSARFIHSGAEDFVANGERFGSIIFNEMLYYAADPVGLLQKFEALLLPGGVMLCSIYQRQSHVSLKTRLKRLFNRRRPLSNIHCEKMVRNFMIQANWRILDDREVEAPEKNRSWHVWLAKPQSTSEADPKLLQKLPAKS